MAIVHVPFHLDDHEPGLALPAEADRVVVPQLPDGSVWERLAVLHEAVAADVAAVAEAGDVPVVASGCCTTALGTVAGLRRAGTVPAVVWFDGHGDVQSPHTSTSGYPGGMVLRQLVGGADRTSPDRLGLAPIPEADVVLVDARDLDPPEVEFLAGSAIRHVRVDEVAALRLPTRPYYLHLDLDVLDPRNVHGLRFPTPGGPDADVLLTALRAVLLANEVAAVGLACTFRSDAGMPPRIAELLAEVSRLAAR